MQSSGDDGRRESFGRTYSQWLTLTPKVDDSMLSALEVVQNAYVVRDLEEACARFNRLLGIGPFVGGNEFELASHVYRGRAADPIKLRIAFVQSGNLNIELVQLVSGAPSAFHDMFTRDQQGFHHQAVFCANYREQRDEFVAQGCPVASEFTVSWGAQICYIDARHIVGHMIELYPEDAILRDLYRQSRDAAREWNGKDLIVPWKMSE
jgi:Glyoxalase/Bleomycin resistance protein/Dioxygenase superfamily